MCTCSSCVNSMSATVSLRAMTISHGDVRPVGRCWDKMQASSHINHDSD